MKRYKLGTWLIAITAILSAGMTVRGARVPPPGVDAKAAFERMKSLEGTWTSTAPGNQATTRFEVTGNGTVLVEHYTNPALPGGGHMMTAYHLDGADLVLTHYCIANNQPTLRAERFNGANGELQFEFVRASNLASPATGHMRRALYRIPDKDHFVTEWEFFEAGTKKMTETEAFTRSK